VNGLDQSDLAQPILMYVLRLTIVVNRLMLFLSFVSCGAPAQSVCVGEGRLMAAGGSTLAVGNVHGMHFFQIDSGPTRAWPCHITFHIGCHASPSSHIVSLCKECRHGPLAPGL